MNNSVKINVALFHFDQDPKDLRAALGIHPSYNLIQLDDIKVAVNSLNTETATLVIASVNSTEDFIQLSTLVKVAKKKKLKTKFVVASHKGQQFDKYAAKLEIMDFIELSASTKALRYKVDLMVKTFLIQLKNSSQKELTAAEIKEAENTPAWTEPLNSKDDMWYISSKNACRKILNKWLVRMIGPSPLVGRWIEVSHGCWEFKFKSENNPFCSKEGRWYFKGNQKPEFIWKENLWLFSSDQYELFYKTEAKILSRVSVKNRILKLCENSEFAFSKLGVISQSFDSASLCEAEVPGDAKEILEKGLEKSDKLRGTGKTSKITDLLLSGKQKTTDHLDFSGHNLESDSNDQNVTPDELSLKNQVVDENPLAFESNFTEIISTFLEKKNKSPNDELSAEPESKDESKNKNANNEDSESSQETSHEKSKNGPLTGKGKTSDLSSPLLARSLEKDEINSAKRKLTPTPLAEKNGKTDDSQECTDELSDLSNKINSLASQNKKDGQSKSLPSEMISTHYEFKEKSKNENSDKEDSESSQETSQEKVEKNNEQKFGESEKGPLSGKGKTSDLSSPLLDGGLENAVKETSKRNPAPTDGSQNKKDGPSKSSATSETISPYSGKINTSQNNESCAETEFKAESKSKNTDKKGSDSSQETSQEKVEKNKKHQFGESENGPLTGKGKTSDFSSPLLAIGVEDVGRTTSKRNPAPADGSQKKKDGPFTSSETSPLENIAGKSFTEHLEKNDGENDSRNVEKGKKDHNQFQLEVDVGENKKPKISNDDIREGASLIEMVAKAKAEKILPLASESQKAEVVPILDSQRKLSDLLKKAVKQYKVG